MLIAIRHKFTLFAITIILALPLSLFGRIFERDGITIEISDSNYLSSNEKLTFKMNPIVLTIKNQINSTLTINKKSILGTKVTKDPLIVLKHFFEKRHRSSTFMNSPLFAFLWSYTTSSILCDIRGIQGNCYAGGAAGLLTYFVLKKIEEAFFISNHLNDTKELLYRPYTQVSYLGGLYTKQHPWELIIDPSESDELIILLDETCKKFTFDVFKSSGNSEPERVRFRIELEDSANAPSQEGK